jgi:transposase
MNFIQQRSTSPSFMKIFFGPSEVYLYWDFVDLRKATNGLVALVEDELNRDVYTGTLFAFCNKAKKTENIVLG